MGGVQSAGLEPGEIHPASVARLEQQQIQRQQQTGDRTGSDQQYSPGEKVLTARPQVASEVPPGPPGLLQAAAQLPLRGGAGQGGRPRQARQGSKQLFPFTTGIFTTVFVSYPNCICVLSQLYLSLIPIVFVSYPNCICLLSPIVFVSYPNCICLLARLYLSLSPIVFVSYPNCICLLSRLYLSLIPIVCSPVTS